MIPFELRVVVLKMAFNFRSRNILCAVSGVKALLLQVFLNNSDRLYYCRLITADGGSVGGVQAGFMHGEAKAQLQAAFKPATSRDGKRLTATTGRQGFESFFLEREKHLPVSETSSEDEATVSRTVFDRQRLHWYPSSISFGVDHRGEVVHYPYKMQSRKTPTCLAALMIGYISRIRLRMGTFRLV